MNRIIILFSIFISLNSCKKRIGNDSYVVVKDGKGNLQSEIHYINDTIKHGLARYYYSVPINRLKEEVEFRFGKKYGWYKHYRKDGTIDSRTHFKKDLADGDNYWYFENGKLKEQTFWSNGKQYGAGTWYYKNGNLETYNVTDFYGEILYVLQRDENGNKIKEAGSVFSKNILAVYINDSTQTPIVEKGVKKNREIGVKITVAQPPQTKIIMKMGELNKVALSNLPIENCTAIYNQKFAEIGKHTLIMTGEIWDSYGNLLKHDSASININVIE
jgi:hypothetical protein